MPPQFQAPVGTRDVLPPESARWEKAIAAFASLAGRAGYGLAVGPLFEELGVFLRVGESTDIVRKEMYDFRDKGDRHMALRPEGTASVVRAFVQHRPTTPWKVWYLSPSFRYDRPQAGRYRQHHQLGVEALGPEDPDLDVEVITLAWRFYEALGLRQVELHVNSIGDAECRPAYRAALLAHLEAHREELCGEHREGFELNPLRVLDCKREGCRQATADAPRAVDHLCDACERHFARVRAGLDALGVPYVVDTRLVRGQDYYTRTTFEFAAVALDAAQNGVGGGGRLDGLTEELGGPATPAIGFGIGIERVLLACDAEGVLPAPEAAVDVFVVDTAGGDSARDLTHELRVAGIRADRAWDGRSMKAQLKAADRSGARVALIVGDDEAAAGTVTIKPLRAAGAEQRTVERADVARATKELLAP